MAQTCVELQADSGIAEQAGRRGLLAAADGGRAPRLRSVPLEPRQTGNSGRDEGVQRIEEADRDEEVALVKGLAAAISVWFNYTGACPP